MGAAAGEVALETGTAGDAGAFATAGGAEVFATGGRLTGEAEV
jgi:hypothetical protein